MGRKKGIFRLLDTVGDGSGVTNAIGNYATTAQGFKMTNAKGWAHIARMILMIEDSGSFDSGLYGNGVALTNGIRVFVKDSADEIIQEFTAFPILTNGDWAGHCHDFNHFNWGQGNEVASVRWTFDKAGQDVIVKFNEGEYFEVLLNDNFSGLVKHRFTIQGHFVTEEF